MKEPAAQRTHHTRTLMHMHFAVKRKHAEGKRMQAPAHAHSAQKATMSVNEKCQVPQYMTTHTISRVQTVTVHANARTTHAP